MYLRPCRTGLCPKPGLPIHSLEDITDRDSFATPAVPAIMLVYHVILKTIPPIVKRCRPPITRPSCFEILVAPGLTAYSLTMKNVNKAKPIRQGRAAGGARARTSAFAQKNAAPIQAGSPAPAQFKPIRRSGTSLHHQIFLVIRDQITVGKYGIGSALPSEQELRSSISCFPNYGACRLGDARSERVRRAPPRNRYVRLGTRAPGAHSRAPSPICSST